MAWILPESLGPVYMRPGRSQTSTNIEICVIFAWDRNEIIPGRFCFGHNSFYSRYLHETGAKIAQTGLKSFRLLDRVERPEWNLFEFTFIPLWFHTGLNIVGPAGGINSDRSEQFSSRSHVNICYKDYYDRNEIAPVWLRPALHFSHIFHSMKIHNYLNQNLKSITLPVIVYTISLLWILDQSFSCVISYKFSCVINTLARLLRRSLGRDFDDTRNINSIFTITVM